MLWQPLLQKGNSSDVTLKAETVQEAAEQPGPRREKSRGRGGKRSHRIFSGVLPNGSRGFRMGKWLATFGF